MIRENALIKKGIRALFHPLLAEIMEYYLVFFVIIECNSMFGYAIGNHSSNVALILRGLAVLLSGYLLLFYLYRCHQEHLSVRKFLPVLAVLMLYVIVFYFLNVYRLHRSATRDYLMLFVWFLPVMTAIFWMQRRLGEGFRFFFQHADLVCVIAGASLFFYVLLTIRPELLYSDLLETRWYGTQSRDFWCNFYNVTNISKNFFRTLLGFPLYLNYGPFAEPLMFDIALHTALYTEMYLRDRGRQRIWKWILLSAAVATTQSSLGLMLLAAAWGLKGMQFFYRRGKRQWIFLCLGILAAVLGALFFQKLRMVNKASGFVLGQHMEDYYLGLKAFLAKPILGSGYGVNSFIRSFMTETRRETDPGFSNSIAMIPAQGGILLALLCYLPVLLCLLQVRKKGRRGLALWAVGPFGMFAVTIFHYRMFMITLFAFGYSLLRQEEPGSGSEERQLTEVTEGKQSSDQALRRGIPAVLCRIGGLLLLFLLALFGLKPLQQIFYRYQLYLGQSSWKFACLVLIMIAWSVWIHDRWKKGTFDSPGGILRFLLFFLAFHGIFLGIYPWIYAKVNTWLTLVWTWRDVVESFLLLGIYFYLLLLARGIGPEGARIVSCFRRGRRPADAEGKRKASGTLSLTAAMTIFGAIAALCLLRSESGAVSAAQPSLSKEREALEIAAQAAEGRLYANKKASLFRRLIPSLSYTTTKDNGFAACRVASVVFAHGDEILDLFDSGYQVTELSDQYILYSNDAGVMDALRGAGYEFHPYYPYARTVNLTSLARKNGLTMTEDGALLIEGEEHSVTQGQDRTLWAGDYTVSYSLHLEDPPKSAEEVVCRLQVGYNGGDTILGDREVIAKDFDLSGDARIELSVAFGDVSGVTCLAIGAGDVSVEIREIRIFRSPDYVTLHTYNCLRQPVTEVYYTEDGKPFVKAEGYARMAVRYNRVGQTLRTDYQDEEQTPVVITGGYASVACAYDRKGRKIRDSYLDAAGEPAVLSNGASTYVYAYDDQNNIIEYRYLGTDGGLIFLSSGYAVLKRTYDDKHHILREWYLDPEEAPCLLPGGYAAVEYEYDAAGNISVYRYYDREDAPVMLSGGYAQLRRSYDDKRWITREEYCDTTGKLYPLPGGYAAVEYTYDAVGNRIVYRYYDADNQPVATTSEYAVLYRDYNDKRQIIRDEYGDVSGNRMALFSGAAATEYEYDASGNISRYIYCGFDGNPVMLTGGYAMLYREYNELRQITRNDFLDTEGELVALSNGVAMERYAYDARGNRTEWDYYGSDRQPLTVPGGYSQLHRSYNSMNKILREWYCDTEGKETLLPAGYASVEYTYDENGTEIGRTYYDLDGTPVEPEG